MKKLLLSLLLATPALAQDIPKWESNMLYFGKKNCDFLKSNATHNEKLNATYYDAVRVFQSIQDYTGDKATWSPCVDAARKVYRDDYVLPANGGVPGFWNFSLGLRQDFERR